MPKRKSKVSRPPLWPAPPVPSPELQKALDAFPALVKEKERNFLLREKDIRRFDKLVKQLKKARVGF